MLVNYFKLNIYTIKSKNNRIWNLFKLKNLKLSLKLKAVLNYWIKIEIKKIIIIYRKNKKS